MWHKQLEHFDLTDEHVNDTEVANSDASSERADIKDAIARLKHIEADLEFLSKSERAKDHGPKWGVRLAHFIESHWSVRVSTFTLTVFALLSGIAGILIYLEESTTRQEERLARAWQNLATLGVGNSGKGIAISHIARSGANLDHIDLSCESMGGYGIDSEVFSQDSRFMFDDEKCIRPPVIADMNVTSDDKTSMTRVNFRDAIIQNSSLRGVSLSDVDLTATQISNFELQDSDACNIFWGYADLQSVEIDRLKSDCSSGVGTSIYWPKVSLREVNISRSDLGNSCFTNAVITDSVFNDSDLTSSIFFQTNFWENASFHSSNLTQTKWLNWEGSLNLLSGEEMLNSQIPSDYFDFLERQENDDGQSASWAFRADDKYPIVIGPFNKSSLGCSIDLVHNLSTQEFSEILRKFRDLAPQSLAKAEAFLNRLEKGYEIQYKDGTRVRKMPLKFEEIDFENTFATFFFTDRANRDSSHAGYLVAVEEIEEYRKSGNRSVLSDWSDLNVGLIKTTSSDYAIGFGDPDTLIVPKSGVLMPLSYFPQILPGMPATAGPHWVCFSIGENGDELTGVARRPANENCIKNPWYAGETTADLGDANVE